MELKHKYWLAVVGLPCLLLLAGAGVGARLFVSIPPESRDVCLETLMPFGGWLLFGLFFAVMIYLLVISDIYHAYILPIDRISEEASLIATVNPAHRLSITGCAELKRLAQNINDVAENLQGLQQSLGVHLQTLTNELDRERHILSEVIEHLPQAVIGVNAAGNIFLYNEQAMAMLPCSEQDSGKGFICGFLGLGRSIYSLVEPGMLDYVFQTCRIAMRMGKQNKGVRFMLRGPGDRFFSAVMDPIPDGSGEPAGFILILEDISEQTHQERSAMDVLDWFMEETRSQAVGLCQNLDDLLEGGLPEPEQTLRRYRSMICDSVNSLRHDVQQGVTELSRILGARWPIHRIYMQDFFHLIENEAKSDLHMDVYLHSDVCENKLEGEVFTLVQTMLSLLRLLREEHDVRSVFFSGQSRAYGCEIILSWRGEPVARDSLTTWMNRSVLGGPDPVLRIRDVLKHHGAKWYSRKAYGGLSSLHIAFPGPEQTPEQADPGLSGLTGSTYDFSLLSQKAGETDTEHPLTDLIYTVFDLETTGLDVRSGDKIVAIAGVRIVNGRIAGSEVFDKLVDPGRPVPREAARIHGLDNEKLRGKPPVEEVLPLFYKFAEGTVLVAHCADFDMGFLKAKEHRTGICFSNPVLDTFKLSVLVHPTRKKHELESIAARLGTTVYNRHSALGDAWTTAEILLGLLPLLAKQGITTLEQAVQAGQVAKDARLTKASVSVGNNDFRERQGEGIR